MRPAFLTAEWRRLLMLNYPVESSVLASYVPSGTELDTSLGKHFISLVAFQFLDTRVKGIAVPFHRHFEEINLRFYVRFKSPEGWRRGVVFVREVVPKPAIALVARWLYNENYVTCPTRATTIDPSGATVGKVSYGWRHEGDWLSVAACYVGSPEIPAAGSHEEFITEHYWGYSTQRDGSTIEYQVEHPQWRVWYAFEPEIRGDFVSFYGAALVEGLTDPYSTFVAEGSRITVYEGERVDHGVTG